MDKMDEDRPSDGEKKNGVIKGETRKQKVSHILKTAGHRKNSATLFMTTEKPRLLFSLPIHIKCCNMLKFQETR